MYSGQACIDYLAGTVSQSDPAASSHWRKFGADFQFSGKDFQGLNGFGGCSRPYRGVRRIVHQLLQSRFRRIGSTHPGFTEFEKIAKEITSRQDRAVDLDVLRQVITLAFLKRLVPEILVPKGLVCVIGDGFASMTSLLLASRSAGQVVLVNLNKTLLVDLWYLKLWMGRASFESRVHLITDEEDLAAALAQPREDDSGAVLAIQASQHELLRKCPIDLALNVVSMQEMDPPMIAEYFEDLRVSAGRSPILFYCCNREEKVLPDGTITRFSEYPWRQGDEVLIDERCPWHQQYYSTSPPFYRAYDGPIRHRLTRLSPHVSSAV